MMVGHWYILFICLFFFKNGSNAEEQSGSLPLSSSSASSVTVHVDFNTPFTVPPYIYSWVRNGIGGDLEFTTTVIMETTTFFEVVVTRTDANAGWDGSQTFYWEAQTTYSSNTLTSSDSNILEWHQQFDKTYSAVPEVIAWARGLTKYPDKFSVTVTSVDENGFNCNVQRIDTTGLWGQTPVLYWSVTEIDANAMESKSLVGDPTGVAFFGYPDATWIYTPAFDDSTADVFDVLGREVYLTTVRQLLVEHSNGQFPLTQTTSTSTNLELVVRGDTVYVDQDTINFQGLKSITIIARKLVANDADLVLEAPKTCQSISGSTCQYYGQAGQSQDGSNGKRGVNSPTIDIYIHIIEGGLNIISRASDGARGEQGGSGKPGQDNEYESPALTNDESCKKACGPLFGELRYKGKPGPDGGPGGHSYRAGKSGTGGVASAATIYTESVSGYIELRQYPGTGGEPAQHGYGGRGGRGGTGGCGRRCRAWLMCIIIICWPECTSDQSCDDRGDPGQTGTSGEDGYTQYPVSTRGSTGAISLTNLRQVSSVKTWFESDTDLLNVIRRHGESLFQRNDNVEAANVFNFILSVTSPTSKIYQEVAYKLRMINQGFDYYGHTEEYAPDLDWSYISIRTDQLIESGETFEDAYNSVMEDVEDIMLVSNTMDQVVALVVSAQDRELQNLETELKAQKTLYVKALKQLELTMTSEMLQIYVYVPLAIVQDVLMDSDFISLLGGLVAFAGGLISNTPVEALQGAMKTIDALNGRNCNAPTIMESIPILQEKRPQMIATNAMITTQEVQSNLEFAYEFQLIRPEDLDFSTMDASSVTAIMLSDLAKNKAMLVQEISCLYENSADSNLVKNLERVIDDYFRDGAFRILLIDRIMNIDVQLKAIGYNRELLVEVEQVVDETVASVGSSVSTSVKMSFTDMMFNIYQEQENFIMRSIYELSKAYQFSCLWDFDALSKYNDFFGDEVMTSNTGQLMGMLELKYIRDDLEAQRDVFLNLVASSAGPASHVFNTYWEFNEDTHPDVISDLQRRGEFTIKINIDPNDVTTLGCADCFNGRLEALYVEIDGVAQDSNVPTTIYVKVSHMGDSHFLVPYNNGTTGVKLLQQTPENSDGGHVMSFDSSKTVKSISDPALEVKFLKTEHKFCENSYEFFGAKPCKSPYATYVIRVPIADTLACSLDPNDLISGTNCQDLDLTKYDTVRVYTKINSWSDYPAQPTSANMSRLKLELSQ